MFLTWDPDKNNQSVRDAITFTQDLQFFGFTINISFLRSGTADVCDIGL